MKLDPVTENVSNDRVVAGVVTAVPLTEALAEKLQAELVRLAGKPVLLKSSVDESILGGAIVRMGDKVIDGSIRHKLEELRKRLSGLEDER
jgi:F-type H+-transporting ATPase subunit delta